MSKLDILQGLEIEKAEYDQEKGILALGLVGRGNFWMKVEIKCTEFALIQPDFSDFGFDIVPIGLSDSFED